MLEFPLARMVIANARRVGVPLVARALRVPSRPPPQPKTPQQQKRALPLALPPAATWLIDKAEDVNPALASARTAAWAITHPREALQKAEDAVMAMKAGGRGLEDAISGGRTNDIYANVGAHLGFGGEGDLQHRREVLLARENALDARDRQEHPQARQLGRDIPTAVEFLSRAASIPAGGLSDQNLQRMDQLLRNREVEHPSFTESLVPVAGSLQEAVADYQDDNYFGAGLNAIMGATDIFPVKAGWQAAGKVAARKAFFKQPKSWLEDPYRWSGRDGARAWMKAAGYFAPDEIGHHWLAKQGGWLEKKLGKHITNQPWNILPVDWLTHAKLHGDFQQEQYRLIDRLARGTPGWAKTLVSQAALRPIQIGENLLDEPAD